MNAAQLLGHLDLEIQNGEKLVKFGDFKEGVRVIVGVSEQLRELEKKEITETIKDALTSRYERCAEIILEGTEKSEISRHQPSGGLSAPKGNRIQLEDILVKPDDTILLHDVLGMKQAKIALIQAVVLPNAIKGMVPFENQWRGILLFGNPGTGKTKVVKAFINSLAFTTDIKVNFLNVTLDKVCGSHHGDTQKNLSEIFEIAKSSSPSILLFDELDSLCSDRDKQKHESDIKITNHFLTVMDGITSTNPIIVIATTNKPYKLDYAFFRRFQKMIYVELPGKAERELLLRHFVKRIQSDLVSGGIDFEGLAVETWRYSPADLLSLVTEAVQQTRCNRVSKEALKKMEMKEIIDFTQLPGFNDGILFVTQEHFKTAKRFIKASADEEQISKLDTFANKYCGRLLDYEYAPPDCQCCTYKECLETPLDVIIRGCLYCYRFFCE